MTTKDLDPRDLFRMDDKEPIAFVPLNLPPKNRHGFFNVPRKKNMATKNPDPNALFQVNNEEPITFEHLLRANPELGDAEVEKICEMRVSQTERFGHALLRRTR